MLAKELISKDILSKVGYGEELPGKFSPSKVVLRDGRPAVVWIHNDTGHGVLDPEFWECSDFYRQEYRKQFGPVLGAHIEPEKNFEINRGLNKRQFQIFSHLIKKNSKLLEVGCSFGGILNLARDFGINDYTGVEPNTDDASFVQRKNPGVTVVNEDFEKAVLPENHYDFLVSIEVLEHVIDPVYFLKKCSCLLKKGGGLHLEVPNHHDVLFYTYKNEGYQKFYYHKAHIHYFTPKSLMEFSEKSGFDGKVSSFLMYPFFNHVWWAQHHCPQLSGSQALASFAPVPADDQNASEINEFYRRAEKEYEELINERMLGDCLIFQGKKV